MPKPQASFFLTECLGQRVFDNHGVAVGKLVDLAVRVHHPYPTVTSLVVRQERTEKMFSWQSVERLTATKIQLASGQLTKEEGSLADDQLRLKRHLLDAQIIDLNGQSRARVGDIELNKTAGGELLLVAVDIGQKALLRRLGLGFLAGHLQPKSVDWKDVHIVSLRGHQIQLRAERDLKLRTPQELAELIARMHPLRSAELLTNVGLERASEAIVLLQPAIAAAALRHLDSEQQTAILHKLPTDYVNQLNPLLTLRAPARQRARARFARVLKVRRHAPS